MPPATTMARATTASSAPATMAAAERGAAGTRGGLGGRDAHGEGCLLGSERSAQRETRGTFASSRGSTRLGAVDYGSGRLSRPFPSSYGAPTSSVAGGFGGPEPPLEDLHTL